MNIKIVFGERERCEFGNGFNARFLGEVRQLYPVDLPGTARIIEPPAEVDVVAISKIGKVSPFEENTHMYKLFADRRTTWWQLVTNLKIIRATKREEVDEVPEGVSKISVAEYRDFEKIAAMVKSAYRAGGIQQEEVIVHLSYDTFVASKKE